MCPAHDRNLRRDDEREKGEGEHRGTHRRGGDDERTDDPHDDEPREEETASRTSTRRGAPPGSVSKVTTSATARSPANGRIETIPSGPCSIVTSVSPNVPCAASLPQRKISSSVIWGEVAVAAASVAADTSRSATTVPRERR